MEIQNENVEVQITNPETPVVENEVTVEQPVQENVTEEVKTPKYFKSFEKQEDWEQYHTTIVNKANTELLKSFNVSSVKELQDKLANYESTTTSMKAELESIKQEKALVNVNEGFKEDAIALAKLAMTKNDKLTLDQAVESILDKNPTWRVSSKPAKLGMDKTDPKHEGTKSKVMEEFLRRNPNIRLD